jgi:hypothetical protein
MDADIDPNARPSDVTEETWSKAAETAADEEEIMTGQARSPFADEDDDIDPEAEEEALRRLAAEAEEKATEDKATAEKAPEGDKPEGGKQE